MVALSHLDAVDLCGGQVWIGRSVVGKILPDRSLIKRIEPLAVRRENVFVVEFAQKAHNRRAHNLPITRREMACSSSSFIHVRSAVGFVHTSVGRAMECGPRRWHFSIGLAHGGCRIDRRRAYGDAWIACCQRAFTRRVSSTWGWACLGSPSAPANKGRATELNPTDRGKLGQSRHPVTDGRGTPLGFYLSGANRHDSVMRAATFDAILTLGNGRRG